MANGYISVYNGSDEKKLPIGFSWTVLSCLRGENHGIHAVDETSLTTS